MQSKLKIGIRSKIILGYIVIVLCLLISVIILNDQIRALQKERNSIIDYDSNIHELTTAIEKYIVNMESGQRGYVITGEQSYLDPYYVGLENWDDTYNKLYELVQDESQLADLEKVKVNIEHWIETAGEPVIEYKQQNDTAAINDFFLTDPGREDMDQIKEKFNSFRADERKTSDTRANQLDSQNNQLTLLLFGALVLISVGSILIANQISKSIVRTIKEVTGSIQTIATSTGEISTRIKVKSNDEIKELAEATNMLLDNLEERNWLQSNVADIVTKFQGISVLETLSDLFISEIAKKTDANFGAFYIKDNQHNQISYVKVASFAEGENQVGRDNFLFGQGLMGQCAKEKTVLYMKDIPKDYRLISTGLGEVLPRSIMIIPILFEEEVIAVAELASVTEFTSLEQDLIKQLASSFGVTVNSILTRMEIVRLLNESRTMTEELQVQSEELQTQSEELQSQSEELQMQKEELMATNEQLEERSKEAEGKNIELEKAKEELEARTEQVIKNSNYKSEFLANMSHELRTPLNSILILSEMLAENDSNNLSAEETEFANVIHSSGKDLLSLINDILDLSKVEAGKLDIHFSEVSIKEVTSQLERVFAPVANQKNVSFEIEMEKDLDGIVYTDEKRFQQILKNLLSNALKFTEKGSVSLHVKKKKLLTSGMKSISSDWLEIIVTDTGIGIPKEKHKLIFETFQQADGATVRKYGGTGLGLSICREFARLLGGWISLSSEEGKGSKFTLSIPSLPQGISEVTMEVATSENEETIEEQLDEQEIPVLESIEKGTLPLKEEQEEFKGKNVLIVDDDNRNIFALRITLERLGMEVTVAQNGMDCLSILEQSQEFDVILMDIMMPNMNGYDTMKIIRNSMHLTEIPIIALTAKAMKYDREKCIEAGASDYISKPLDLDQLYSVLRVWLVK
ncbi:ATP-binding protein [Bacillus sp. B1-b2]|uniref:ATP-binding protein n=1 Tax=Bacillus sp. B1-b2 TaxID=2653201 RepID=UPI001261FA1E|nr:ATP-binding protein [Bacillus sp. B1-b2]KAB7670802.1 response regulator [Bacillus sp. B1-b2]